MKVFIVTNGFYDEYTIIAVFSTREKAAEYIKKAKGSDYPSNLDSPSIEEYEVDSSPRIAKEE